MSISQDRVLVFLHSAKSSVDRAFEVKFYQFFDSLFKYSNLGESQFESPANRSKFISVSNLAFSHFILQLGIHFEKIKIWLARLLVT